MKSRKKLPETRNGLTHKFTINDLEGYLRTGEYDDGKLGEIFIDISKQGSTLNGLLDSLAIMTSMGLQNGVSLYSMVAKFCYVRYEPSGITPNSAIRFAYSITDYVFRWLGLHYLSVKEQNSLDLLPHEIDADIPHHGISM